jgi:hypothetical protein
MPIVFFPCVNARFLLFNAAAFLFKTLLAKQKTAHYNDDTMSCMKNLAILWFCIPLFILFGNSVLFGQSAGDFSVRLSEDGEGVIITGYTGKAARVIIPAIIEDLPQQ